MVFIAQWPDNLLPESYKELNKVILPMDKEGPERHSQSLEDDRDAVYDLLAESFSIALACDKSSKTPFISW